MEDSIETIVQRLLGVLSMAKLIGKAPTFLNAVRQLPAVARGDAAVLISGETGTGKELVARAIHYLGPRAAFPFVPVNCGSLPDTLMEDELFGHERGAFTDAQSRRQGLVSYAENGTLFLDEVDALSPKAQVGLLRVLQDRTFRPLGSSREQRCNVRFIAATNTSLSELVQRGTFRADLYYRLCVFSIDLPPLRDRKEDILHLAAHFTRKYAAADGPEPELTVAARSALLAFDWPGNVRELENAIVRGIQVTQTATIDVADLGLPASFDLQAGRRTGSDRGSFTIMKRQVIDAFERDYLTRLMSDHHGNVSHAARTAGKDRRDLGRLLKKHLLDPKLFAR